MRGISNVVHFRNFLWTISVQFYWYESHKEATKRKLNISVYISWIRWVYFFIACRILKSFMLLLMNPSIFSTLSTMDWAWTMKTNFWSNWIPIITFITFVYSAIYMLLKKSSYNTHFEMIFQSLIFYEEYIMFSRLYFSSVYIFKKVIVFT